MGWVFGHSLDAFWGKGKIAVFFIRSTIDLKREIGASSQTDISALKETQRRIESNGEVVGKIRRRFDWKVVRHRMIPVFNLDYLYIGFNTVFKPPFPIDHPSQFPYG